MAAARTIISNPATIAALITEVAAFAPDVVHFHNFFPTLSPAAIDAVARQGIPVVHTLHNFRMICPGALLLRDGKLCEDCVDRSKLCSVIYSCYRGSRLGSALVLVTGLYFNTLLTRHRRLLTLLTRTEFAKSRFLAAGIPADSMAICANFIADPGPGLTTRDRRIVCVARLSHEKGVDTLLRAAANVDGTIEIIGDGPERARLEAIAPSNVIFRGFLPRPQVLERIKSATALAVPSRCYEAGIPITALDAMATGTPVLASRLGSLLEAVIHRDTGILVPQNDVAAWQVEMRLLLLDPHKAAALGARGRARYLQRHTEQAGLNSLTKIYESAMQKSNRVDSGDVT